MPTISDDFSDPEDLPLEDSLPPPTASTSSSTPSRPISNEPISAPQIGPDGAPMIPKALRIGPLGQLYKVDQQEFQKWDTIYPIYVDNKHPQQDGARRISKSVGLEWPLAEQMARACRMMGLETVYEPSKTHPKDWANPGRVRVQLKGEDGKSKVASIPNKRALLKLLCDALRPHQPRAIPPSSLPPIEQRLPPNSPAVSLGTLDQALKGAGPLGMLGNMLGGGSGAGEIEDGKEGEGAVTPKKKEQPKVMKPRKIHMKRR